MSQVVEERGTEMSRELEGVTIETFPLAVRKMGLRRGQTFKIIVEEDEDNRARAIREIQEISAAATARAQADGIVTDQDVDIFLNR